MSANKCQICGKPASFHYSTTVNGKTEEVNLCTECLAKHGGEYKGINDFSNFKNLFSFGNDGGLDAFFGNVFGVEPKKVGAVCPHCGMTAADIASNYKLGCSECYTTFKDLVRDMVANIGGGEHIGKKYQFIGADTKDVTADTPTEKVKNSNEVKNSTDEETRLKNELDKAVKEERYADADKIHKELLKLRESKNK